MRDHYDEFRKRGVELIAFGMGIPEMAAHFRDTENITFPLIVDHTKETYRALEIKRAGGWNVYGPPVWWKGIESLIHGYRNKIPKQDPMQLGGAVVARAGGEVVLVHRAEQSYDFLPVDKLLAAADKAAPEPKPA